RHVYQTLVIQQPLAGGPARNKFRGALQKLLPPRASSRRPGSLPGSLDGDGGAARAAGETASGGAPGQRRRRWRGGSRGGRSRFARRARRRRARARYDLASRSAFAVCMRAPSVTCLSKQVAPPRRIFCAGARAARLTPRITGEYDPLARSAHVMNRTLLGALVGFVLVLASAGVGFLVRDRIGPAPTVAAVARPSAGALQARCREAALG